MEERANGLVLLACPPWPLPLWIDFTYESTILVTQHISTTGLLRRVRDVFYKFIPPFGFDRFFGPGANNVHDGADRYPIAENQNSNQSQGEPIPFVDKP